LTTWRYSKVAALKSGESRSLIPSTVHRGNSERLVRVSKKEGGGKRERDTDTYTYIEREKKRQVWVQSGVLLDIKIIMDD
jgi:hypothetical protein